MINPCCPAHHYPEHYPILSLSKVSDGYIFSLSLVLSFSFFLPCDLFLYVLQQMFMRKDSCCLCKHDHPFSYAFPVAICFRVLPLFKRERCAKMTNFKGGTSCYVLPLFIQLASPTVSCCLQFSSPSRCPILFYIRSFYSPLLICCSQTEQRLQYRVSIDAV